MNHRFVFLLFTVFIGSSSYAEDTRYYGEYGQNLRSEQGVEIKIQAASVCRGWTGQAVEYGFENIRIQVRGPQITPSSNILSLFITQCFYYQSRAQKGSDFIQSNDLYYNPRTEAFENAQMERIPNQFASRHYYESYYCNTEVALVIDGVWQKDPKKTHGFRNFTLGLSAVQVF
jgi:hypothetical protein